MKRIISPSLLSADFSKLDQQIDIVKNAGAKRLHIDCMDGHFVPNFTFGPFILKAIRKLTDLHLETHLMIDNPSKYFDDFINAGADTLIFHQEASGNVFEDLNYIKKWVPNFQNPDYARPIVNHKEARERCLNTYKAALNKV